MKLEYSVTFEFEMRPPVTHKGTVEGGTAGTCAARAARQAQKSLRPVAWSSVVCLLLKPAKKTPGEKDVI
jgi:hypothetical protein